MSALPSFTVQQGQLGTEDDLHEVLGLDEGQRLFVVSANDQEILLRKQSAAKTKPQTVAEVIAVWESIRESFKPKIAWTPEWQTKAEENKRLATLRLDEVYVDPSSGATELKRAEREWELADDELDFGPFSEL